MGMEVGKINDCNITVAGNTNKVAVKRQKSEEKCVPELLAGENKKIKNETDKSKNGKFDISEALLNLGKGLISPLSIFIKHPLLSMGILMGTIYACALAPVLAPILTAGFGLYSLYQIGKGTFDAVKNYESGNYDDAEKSFETVGQGVIGTALSALAIKPSARVVREAKLLATGEKITPEMAPQLLKSGFLTNLKELGSLFATKNGIKAMASQLKPSAIKIRFKKGVLLELVRNEKGKTVRKEEKTTRTLTKKEQIEKFQQSEEGIRRATLTDEQIEQEVLSMSEKLFDKAGIPKNQRPRIEVTKEADTLAGSYNQHTHTLEFNSKAYREGLSEMEETLAHEITHCKESLLRASIPKKRVEEIVMKELLLKAQNGEAKNYITGRGDMFGAEIQEVPKMSAKMREEFYQILKNPSQYKSLRGYKFYDEELAEELLDKYPEFIAQYKDKKEAFNALCSYMYSFEKRFSLYTDNSITKKWIDKNFFRHSEKIPVPEATGQTLTNAEQSLKGMIDTWEGNARISGLNCFMAGKEGFNNYLFSPEEVLAEKNGQSYLIETLSAKLKELKGAKTPSAEEQARLQELIDRAKVIIEYRTKGQTYYKKYIEHINNPENKQLADEVESLETQIFYLKERAFPKQQITETKVVEYNEPFLKFNENVTVPFLWSYKFLENK